MPTLLFFDNNILVWPGFGPLILTLCPKGSVCFLVAGLFGKSASSVNYQYIRESSASSICSHVYNAFAVKGLAVSA